MKIAAVQMISTPDVVRNLDAARRLVAQAAADGARLVALPEYFCLLGRHERDKLAHAETAGDGPIQLALAQMARDSRVWLIGGTLPMRIEGNPQRVRNACCVYTPDGAQAARYDKIHLFSFKSGHEAHDESRVLEAGTEPVAFDAAASGNDPPLRVGLSVCYDLRFPELYRALGAAAPCDLLSVPSAFTYPTGEAHWELLLRARAVENQAYVIGVNRIGMDGNDINYSGDSIALDPQGRSLTAIPSGKEAVATVILSASALEEYRKAFPVHLDADAVSVITQQTV